MVTGGWLQPEPIDPARVPERRRQTRQWIAEDDARIERARLAEFGNQANPTHETITMPLSGRVFIWRSDGRYVNNFVPDKDWLGEEHWTSWDPDDESIGGTHQQAPGESAEPSWWLYWGTARPATSVAVWLADNSDVPIIRLGYLWIAEWRSTAQPAFVAVDGRVSELPMIRPEFLPTATVPWPRTATNPRA